MHTHKYRLRVAYYYQKSVWSKGFKVGDKDPGTLEDDCKEHNWRHRASKYFRVPLPKNWIYCNRCGTEKLETVI